MAKYITTPYGRAILRERGERYGIGIVLSYTLSRACGLYAIDTLLTESEQRAWDVVMRTARDAVDQAGLRGDVEVYATHPRWPTWQAGTLFDDRV